MADSGGVSGQQPTARTDYAEVDNLVNEIMELMMDMEIKRIDHSPQKLFFESILRRLDTYSPAVCEERLRKFMTTLQKLYQINTRGVNGGEQPVEDSAGGAHTGGAQQHTEEIAEEIGATVAATAARSSTMREDTKSKCEELRKFGFEYIREQIAAKRPALVTARQGVCCFQRPAGKTGGVDIQDALLGF